MEKNETTIRKVYGGYIMVTIRIDAWNKKTEEEYISPSFKELIEWMRGHFGEIEI